MDEVIPKNPVIGVAYMNWMPYVTSKVPEGLGPSGTIQEPCNIYIQAAAEVGDIGLTVFAILIFLAFRQNSRTQSLAKTLGKPYLDSLAYGLDAGLIGYLVAGSFVIVLYYPFFWIQLTLIATLYFVTKRFTSKIADRNVKHGDGVTGLR